MLEYTSCSSDGRMGLDGVNDMVVDVRIHLEYKCSSGPYHLEQLMRRVTLQKEASHPCKTKKYIVTNGNVIHAFSMNIFDVRIVHPQCHDEV